MSLQRKANIFQHEVISINELVTPKLNKRVITLKGSYTDYNRIESNRIVFN